MVKKTIQKKKKVETKKKVQTKGKDQIKFIGQVTKIRQKEPATVIEWPRSLTHVHTYGMLSPFFEGLRKGELRATRLSKQELSRKPSLDSTPGSLPRLPY